MSDQKALAVLRNLSKAACDEMECKNPEEQTLRGSNVRSTYPCSLSAVSCEDVHATREISTPSPDRNHNACPLRQESLSESNSLMRSRNYSHRENNGVLHSIDSTLENSQIPKKSFRGVSCHKKAVYAHKNLLPEYKNKVLLNVLKNYASQYYALQPLKPSKKTSLPCFWVKILPICTMDFLDLGSILQLRQTCFHLYYKGRYGLTSCTFEKWCTLTEQELINHILPQLQIFLTPKSMADLNFSHCCLLTDTFPSALLGSLTNTSFCQNLRSLYFDFCYALTDKSLEVLLKTHLPCLEILSFRCARSRDLTGAPFSVRNLLTSARWPRFHQLSCSCTQITLAHLDSVAEFIAERAVELGVAPKLGISGSLASNSLIRRLGLEHAHHKFIDAIILNEVQAVEEACLYFEEKWADTMNSAEIQKKVLHRLVRHRATTILVNAPCSVAVVDDGEGREKAIWFLRFRQDTVKQLNQNASLQMQSILNSSSNASCMAQLPGDACMSRQQIASTQVYTLHDEEIAVHEPGCQEHNTNNSLSKNLYYVHYSRWSYPLPIAVRLGNLSLVEFLIKKGTYVDVWGYNFATPLYIAGSHVTNDTQGNSQGVSRLRNASENNVVLSTKTKNDLIGNISETFNNPDVQRSSSNADKSMCAEHGNENRLQMVYLLLRNGAPVNAPDLYSVKCPVNAAIKNDNKDLLELFLAHGAAINVRALNHSVIPPLIQVSRRQQQKKRPQKGLTRLGYKSPLFFACELQAWKCVSVLLDHNADPHWRDPFSHRSLTPTLLAYRKNPSMLRLFVSKGAGSTHETRWVLSEVLAAAILQDDISTVGYLVTRYPDLLQRESSGMWSLPLHQCSRLNRKHVAEKLLSLGNQPNATNVDNFTPLHFAASEGHYEIIELLLFYGADPNLKGGPQLNTALHMAVEENHMEAVETLLKYKADLTIRNNAGLTPLMVAIVARHDKLAPLLIHSANSVEDLDIVDYIHRSALMYAIHFCQFKVADLLVEKGVSVRLCDITGATPESILKEKIHSLGKSSLSLNKFFWNIVNAAHSTHLNQSTGHNERKKKETSLDANEQLCCVPDKAEPGQASDESVRKLNAKRKKLAKQLLSKIRLRSKKSSSIPPTIKLDFLRQTSCESPCTPSRELCNPKNELCPFSSSLSSSAQSSDAVKSQFGPVPMPNMTCIVHQ